MSIEKELESYAKSELEKELRKFKCNVHNQHPKIKLSNFGGAVIECCCPEFESFVKPHFED